MKSLNIHIPPGDHLSEEEIAMWVEALDGDWVETLPEPLLKHVEQCSLCRELIVETTQAITSEKIGRISNFPDLKRLYNPFVNSLFFKIAAIILIFIVIGVVLFRSFTSQKSDSHKLFAKNFTPYPDMITSKSVSQNSDPLFGLLLIGMNYYSELKFDSALLIFTHLHRISPENDTISFYQGIAILATEKAPDSAILIFSNLIHKNSYFSTQSQWYLSLAYIKQEDTEKAIPLLQELQLESDYYKAKATCLLQKLGD